MIDASLIRFEELSPVYQDICRIIGVEATIKLGLELGGEKLYFPRLDRGTGALIKARNRQIFDKYVKKESTVKAIARKYNLTERQIFHIVKKQES